MGGLRFRVTPGGPFLDDNTAPASPPWTLRALERASLQLDATIRRKMPQYSAWLRLLIAPGGSLGGASPKAGVVDPQGFVWIAKFPSPAEATYVGAWECVVHQLAAGRRGSSWRPAEAQKFGSRRHTFLSKRFDRHRGRPAAALRLRDERSWAAPTGMTPQAGRVTSRSPSSSCGHGVQVEEDLEQLWRRIVFSVCVSNADDHLRNHGFLLRPDGWVLSPAFDMNPVVTADGLKLNISEYDNAQDLSLVMEVAPYFRLPASRAAEIVYEVVTVVKGWRKAATSRGISSGEQNCMARAFRISDRWTRHSYH